MAAIDKIYLNSYDDYVALKEWCIKQPVIYDKYGIPCKLVDYLYKYTKDEWNNNNAPCHVVFNLPYYLDAYLIRNCPVKAVQEELMINYGHWSQEKIDEAYKIVTNRASGNEMYNDIYYLWLTEDDFVVKDGVVTMPNLEKSTYQKIKDGELYVSAKREQYEYGKHIKCIKHPINHYNTPFKRKMWIVDIEVPNGDIMWYHNNHNSWDFHDEFVISDWISSTAYCKTIKALKRLIRKWKLPVGTIIRATGRYEFDDYKFVVKK